MINATAPTIDANANTLARPAVTPPQPVRIKSQDLFQLAREVEIEHQGRIYRMRLTQQNKLILTA